MSPSLSLNHVISFIFLFVSSNSSSSFFPLFGLFSETRSTTKSNLRTSFNNLLIFECLSLCLILQYFHFLYLYLTVFFDSFVYPLFSHIYTLYPRLYLYFSALKLHLHIAILISFLVISQVALFATLSSCKSYIGISISCVFD